MSVKETGVSYYGFSYPDHARKDFQEMKAHNCTAVLLALTEFDLFFWKPQIPKIVDAAKKEGLTVYLNTWGIGKFFGGEAPSIFLQECDIADRQYTALAGEPLPAASPHAPAFREYFFSLIDELAKTCDADGFFWDEPHYAMPVYPVSYQSTADWSCRGPHAQRRFKETYGYELPQSLTYQVKKWRHDEANNLLGECSRIAKARNKNLTITQCSLPADNNYYLGMQRGFDDWRAIAERDDIDIFSTSIITDYGLPLSVHKKIADETVSLARKNKKKSQRWVMSYFQSPENLKMIEDVVFCYRDAGIESIFSWTYRAGAGTFLQAPEPLKVWDILGKAYGKVLES